MAASSIRFVGGRYGVPNGTLSALLRAGIDKSSWPNTNLSSVCQPQIIYSCHVAFPPDRGSTQPGAVSVSSDGIIDGCYPNLSIYQAKSLAETLNRDLTDLGPDIALSPGLIDVHCHISELGRDWEGYSTATRAAAAGGITTLMGMPLNSIPATTSTDALVREVAAASNDGTTLMADVGLWGGLFRPMQQTLRRCRDYWMEVYSVSRHSLPLFRLAPDTTLSILSSLQPRRGFAAIERSPC